MLDMCDLSIFSRFSIVSKNPLSESTSPLILVGFHCPILIGASPRTISSSSDGIGRPASNRKHCLKSCDPNFEYFEDIMFKSSLVTGGQDMSFQGPIQASGILFCFSFFSELFIFVVVSCKVNTSP
ncbi:hypothetical protein ABW19_dt0203668 [Dactylella cylindrospora]|nr:hypothetical protein ABW19_dt0203668 [Dactylella cylindrospora]